MITETAKTELYQVYSGCSCKTNRLDNFTVKNTNTIMVMEFLIHGHPYLHSTEKQLYVIVELLRAQFPLIPAAAVTILKCQGSTLQNVVVDMDVSPSPYYAENFKQAKNFYQHAHYVAASRVPSISGLQIINWSPEYIGVNKKVEEHMKYMNKHNKLKLLHTSA